MMNTWVILNKGARAIGKLLGIIAVTIFIAIGLRLIVFSPFTIPSKSMLPVLRPGDFIIGTKLVPGPRFSLKLKKEGLQYLRLPGFSKIKRNDVLIFNPYISDSNRISISHNSVLAKRCIAIGGDTISIQNGYFLVNRIPSGNITNQSKLSGMTKVDVRTSGIFWGTFPWHSSFYNWTIKDFGPLYVPKAGDVIVLNPKTLPLYDKLIELESGKRPLLIDEQVYLGTNKLTNYTFKYNYYFMSGDNVQDSNDSRYWGLLPEPLVIGKAIIVVASKNSSGGYIFKNLFKIIK